MKKTELFEKVKAMSNSLRFEILELTQDEELTITELSSKLKLTYTTCADYVTILNKANLVSKTQVGKEVKVRSKVKLVENQILF